MITDERMNVFLDSLDGPEEALTDTMYREAKAMGIPVIRQQMKSFIQVMLQISRPERILEIGSGVGYSAVFMAHCCEGRCAITTIERDAERAAKARENIHLSPYGSSITLLEGDALEIMKDLQGEVDMIFMDAAKGQYIHFLPDSLRLLRRGGLLITDNVLREGDILESRFAVERRDRTIHKRVRDYLYEIKHNEQLCTTILPLADGVAVSVKQ